MAAISKWTVPKHLCHIEFSPGHGGCFAVWLPFFFLHELIKKYENWQHCAKCHWELMAKGKKLLECLLVLVRIVHRSYMGEGARGGDQDVEVPREFCQFVWGYISESLQKDNFSCGSVVSSTRMERAPLCYQTICLLCPAHVHLCRQKSVLSLWGSGRHLSLDLNSLPIYFLTCVNSAAALSLPFCSVPYISNEVSAQRRKVF